MTHEHCDKCFLNNCLQTSPCALVYCSNGCFARMHECKRIDHENLCPNSFVSCLNVNYGCPTKVRRADLTRHLRICPASIVICSFHYHHDFYLKKFDELNRTNFLQQLARRDNIWSEHLSEFTKKQEVFLELNRRRKQKKIEEKVIRSQKYPYITMPECMLSRGDGIICSACRIHLRQLEENEDQRLVELSEEDRKAMDHLKSNSISLSNPTSLSPSLVQMSSTLVTSSDLSTSDLLPTSSQSNVDLSTNDPLPIISDTELPTSYIYRLNFFASNDHSQIIKDLNPSPRFACLALIRRDEIEAHYLIHFRIDCILNTSFIQSCPKWQYGCQFQSERYEPCQINGQAMQMRFDEQNDAIAFQWYSNSSEETNRSCLLLDLPMEILEKILLKLDSLSLRNTSLVCRRLRLLCQNILPSRGIVITEYQRLPLSHGDLTWIERKKHWLFTNTSSLVPKWQLKSLDKSTSLSQHLMTCSYGEIKDLQNEPPFRLLALPKPPDNAQSTEVDEQPFYPVTSPFI